MRLKDIKSSMPFIALAQDVDLCTEVQQALKREGLLQLVDGIYGDKTQNALVQYKVKKGISGGNQLGPTTAAFLLKSLESRVLLKRELAEYVYETKLTDAEYADLLRCLETFSITEKEDIREFLAQTAHESGGLRYSEELASGDDYEWREDLGNTQAGDGRKFKGATFLQVTGRANYQRLSDYLKDPRVMEGVGYVASTYMFTGAGFWWYDNGVSDKIAKGADIYQISALVNTGKMSTPIHKINGLDDRLRYYQRAKDVI